MVLDGNEEAMDGASAMAEGRSNFIEILEVRRAHVAGEGPKGTEATASMAFEVLHLPPFRHGRMMYLSLDESRGDMAAEGLGWLDLEAVR